MDFFVFFWRTPCSPPIFVVGPELKSYCCHPLFPWPRATKHKPSQFSHIHLPTNKVKMRLVYNLSGTSHACDALRVENRTERRRHLTSGEKMKIVCSVDAMMATDISGGSGLQGPAEGLVLRRHNVGMGQRGPRAVRRDAPPRNRDPTLPGLLSSPYDGVGRQRDPGTRRRGGVHPARMHRPSTARRRGLQQVLQSEG